MPTALYAVSYQQTGLVLSFCELAKQDLSKAGAGQALLDQIVGTQLQLSLQLLLPPATTPTDPIKVDKAQLALDEVTVASSDIPKTTDYMTACLQRFQLPSSPSPFPPIPLLDLLMLDLSDATAKAGDGTVKKLIDPTQLKPAAVSLVAGVGLKVGDPATFAAGTRLNAIIDGAPQPPVDVPQPPIQVQFPFNATLNTWHTVVVATRGYKPFFGLMQAQ